MRVSSEEIIKRFAELLHKGDAILSTRLRGNYSADTVNDALAAQWATSCLSFLGRVMGKESEHYKKFAENAVRVARYSYAARACAVLKAAKEDYEGGYLFDTRRQIQAEVFDEFLEQAEYFLKDGYFQIAAVIAGAVLEDGLRKLCHSQGIALSNQPKLDAMNSELAKFGLYDKLIQKKVTWLADIRNKAAHGKWNEFTPEDAADMVKDVRRLMTDYVAT